MPAPVKVSVITRTRNRTDLLKRARAGLAAQSFKNFEWIVVNDGGDTGALDAVLASPLEIDHATQRIDHPVSLGRAGAAIAGLSAARGEYCLFHDDDDALQPSALQAYCDALDGAPKSVAVIGGVRTITEKLSGNSYAPHGAAKTHIPTAPPLLIDLAYRNSFLTIATLFKRSVYESVGGINPELDVLEDWDLWLRLMLEGDVVALPELLSIQYVRIGATGDAAQSAQADHKRADAALRNHYLRQDIKTGAPGLGWLMNLHHRQTLEELSSMTRTLRRIKNRAMFWRATPK